MIRCALQRQVQGHLHAQIVRGGDEVVEVVDGAQLGMNGVVAALVAADRPRRPHVAGSGGGGVVAALAVYLADRVDRRQVHHVEPHLGDARQRLGGGGERAVHRVAVGVPAAGRARKHLVPGAEAGQRPIHPDPELLAPGDQFAQRDTPPAVRRRRVPVPARCGSPDPRAPATPPRPPAAGRAARAAHRWPHAPTGRRRPAGRWTAPFRPGPASSLATQPVPPGVHRVPPAVDPERPQPDPVGSELAVEDVGFLAHGHRKSTAA